MVLLFYVLTRKKTMGPNPYQNDLVLLITGEIMGI